MSRRARRERDEVKKPESEARPPLPLEQASMEVVRGRPGRRSAVDREEAVLELMSGKASMDQLARRFGVQPETIEGWRSEALEGMREAMRRGTGRSEREAELERQNVVLRHTVTEGAIAQALLKRALDEERKSRPTAPARSSR
jgi:transposase-like protein